MDATATETVSAVEAMLEGKGEKTEIIDLENGKYSTAHSELHRITGEVVHVHYNKKVVLPKMDIT